MMNALKAGLLLAASFALVCLGIFALQASQAVRSVAGNSSRVSEHADALIASLNATFDDPRQGIKPTLQNVNAILLQAGLATGEVQGAAREQRAYWNTIGSNSSNLIADLDKAAKQADRTVDTVNLAVNAITNATVSTLDSVPPTLVRANQGLEAATRTLNDTNLILESPTIPATQANIQTISSNAAHTSATIDSFATRITKPASFIKQLVLRLAGSAPQSAAILAK